MDVLVMDVLALATAALTEQLNVAIGFVLQIFFRSMACSPRK
jgi:hypothetical protein